MHPMLTVLINKRYTVTGTVTMGEKVLPVDSIMLGYTHDEACADAAGFTEGTDGMPVVTECGCWHAEEDAYLKALDLYLDEPTTYWIYDSEGRRKWNNVTDEPLSFAVFPSADADAEFIESCQVHGINPIHHYYAIASY